MRPPWGETPTGAATGLHRRSEVSSVCRLITRDATTLLNYGSSRLCGGLMTLSMSQGADGFNSTRVRAPVVPYSRAQEGMTRRSHTVTGFHWECSARIRGDHRVIEARLELPPRGPKPARSTTHHDAGPRTERSPASCPFDHQRDQFPTAPDRRSQRPIAPPLRILLPQPPDQRVPLRPLPGRQLVRLDSLPMQLPRPSGPGVRHSPTA